MLKFFFFVAFAFISISNILANDVKTINLAFNENEFIFSYNKNNEIVISSDKYALSYGNNISASALPIIPINVRIPYGRKCVKNDITYKKNVLYRNVKLATNPTIFTYNKDGDISYMNYKEDADTIHF